MADAQLHGRFVWHELMTTDTRSAAAFFSKIIGWKTAPWPGDPSYALFTNGGEPVAGLMTLPDEARAAGAPPNWLTHIGTADVAGTVRKAESLGARVELQPKQLEGVGTFAVLQDPQGAYFAVYAPEQDSSSDGPAGVGGFSWHELATTDYKAAFDFYRQLFGWENAGAQDMGADVGVYQMFGRAGRPLGGIFTKPVSMPGPSYWLPYILVGDAKGVAAAVKKAKASILNGPMEVPGGDWIAQGMDLQGAVFAVHSLKPAAAAKAVKPAARKSVRKAVKRAAKKASAALKRSAGKAKRAVAARKAKAAKKKTMKKTAARSASVRKTGAKKKARPAARARRPAKKSTRR